MNFRTSRKRHMINRTALNLSSMIDVTFLLLIYFIVTTVFNLTEDNLSPTLSVEQGKSEQEIEFEPQIITVALQGSLPVYKLGDQIIVDRQSLIALIEKLPHEPGIIVRVHDDVPVGFAVAAIQEARNAGFDKVTYVPAND